MDTLKRTIMNVVGFDNVMLIKSFFKTQQEKELLLKRRNFYLQFLQPGDTYFDVGANMGNRIEPLINQGINIVAVEPQPNLVRYLTRKFGDTITLIPKGLGAEETEAQMFISSAHVFSSFSTDWIDSVRNSGRFKEHTWEETATVQITTLDALIKQFGKPRFIKIDVEGYEFEVLKGLSTPIEIISFEYTTPEQTQKALDCLTKLHSLSPAMRCNYSIGEELEWALPQWISFEQMRQHIQSPEFIDTDFGDIYVKTVK
ncbi:FkbM family methyltransferase [Hymenobacter sp. HD11105]